MSLSTTDLTPAERRAILEQLREGDARRRAERLAAQRRQLSGSDSSPAARTGQDGKTPIAPVVDLAAWRRARGR